MNLSGSENRVGSDRHRAREPKMVIDVGEIVHVIDRRGFEADLRRHFVGVVEQVDKLALRVVGYAFIYDTSDSTFIRRDEKRTRVIPLTSGLIINVAPPDRPRERALRSGRKRTCHRDRRWCLHPGYHGVRPVPVITHSPSSWTRKYGLRSRGGA